MNKIILIVLMLGLFLINGCSSYIQTQIDSKWINEEIEKGNIEIYDETTYRILNPCIIDPNQDTMITEYIIKECCDKNLSCHFETPRYEVCNGYDCYKND